MDPSQAVLFHATTGSNQLISNNGASEFTFPDCPKIRSNLECVINTSENCLASIDTCVFDSKIDSSASIDVHSDTGSVSDVGKFALAGTANVPNENAVWETCSY